MMGLESVTLDEQILNLSVGRNTETDEELRRRRMFSVQQTSTSTLASIRSNLYSLDGVQHVAYFENETEKEDERGLPMKSFEYIIDGGVGTDIAQVIFNNKPAGTRAFGTRQEIVKDSEGLIHAIGFTPAQPVNIGINIRVETYSAQANSWKNEVAKALKEKFDNIQDIGTSVKDYNYYTVLTQYNEIADIHKVEFYNIDQEGEKNYYTNYPIDIRQIAKLDVKNISIIISQKI